MPNKRKKIRKKTRGESAYRKRKRTDGNRRPFFQSECFSKLIKVFAISILFRRYSRKLCFPPFLFLRHRRFAASDRLLQLFFPGRENRSAKRLCPDIPPAALACGKSPFRSVRFGQRGHAVVILINRAYVPAKGKFAVGLPPPSGNALRLRKTACRDGA